MKAHQAIPAGDIALDGELVPLLGMADVVDRNVVVLAPEERRCGEIFALAEHVQRRDLSLALRHDPMLDADGLAAQRIRPARDVAGGENSRRIRFETGVDDDAPIDPEACPLGELDARAHAETGHDQIGLKDASSR